MKKIIIMSVLLLTLAGCGQKAAETKDTDQAETTVTTTAKNTNTL